MGPDAWLFDAEVGGGTGLWLGIGMPDDAPPWEAVLDMAEQVQEVAFEVLWRPWPECPHHPNGHPLEPDAQEGQAVWTCPTGGDIVATVGELPV